MSNPNYYETQLLVPFDDANGAVVFQDYSFHNTTMYAPSGAGAAITNANQKFAGHNSVNIPGGANQGISTRTNALVFSSVYFGQVELFVRFTTVGTLQDVFSLVGGSGNQLYCTKNAADRLQFGTASLAATVAGPTIVAGQWYHIAMVIDGYATTSPVPMRVYVDGTQVLSTGVPGVPPFNNVSGLTIGNGPNTGVLNGQVCNARVMNRVIYTGSSITVPTAPFDTGPLPFTYTFDGPGGKTLWYTAPALVLPEVQGIYVQVAKKISYQYGGAGYISGTTKIKGTPNAPVSRKVRLYNDRDGALVSEQWSDAVTGAYTFNYLTLGLSYTVIAYDHLHNFRAVVADNLTPDPMP